MFLTILSSILGALAFADFNFSYIFGFVFLSPLFIFLFREEKLWRLVFGVFVFKIIFSVFALYFVFEPYGFIASIFIFLGLPAVIFLLKKFRFNFDPVWNSSNISNISNASNYLREAIIILPLPFLWIFFENLQARYSFLPTYIGNVGNIFGNSPFLGLANIAGLDSLAFFALVVNILIALMVRCYSPQVAMNFMKKRPYWSNNALIAIIAVATVAAGWGISQIKLQQNYNSYNNQPRAVKIGLVSNNKKFDEDISFFKNNVFTDVEKKLAETMVAQKLNLLTADLRNKQLDILILPEHMIDIDIRNDADKEVMGKFDISNNGILIRAYRELAKELNTNLAATIITIQKRERYNSTLLFDRSGELVGVYNKSHLIFASEYWPFGDWHPFYYDWAEKITAKLGIVAEPDDKYAMFNQIYKFAQGERKLLELKDKNLSFASLICSEIHYPDEVKDLKNSGAQFISNISSNRWVVVGLKNYLYLTDNLRKIESVWLEIPILINGRHESAGVITPDGKINAVGFESPNKNYGIFTGEIMY